MYQNHIPFIFNGNAHFFKTGDGRKTVGALKKAVDFRGSLCKRAEHNRPVGNGFITGNCDFAPEGTPFFQFHKI